jgi:hypothetical protein
VIRTIVLLTLGVLLLALAFRRLRERRLKERYVVLFALLGLPFLALGFWPDGIVYLSELLQIEKATLLVLSLTVFVVLMLLELLTLVSVQDRKLTSLAQEVALLNERLDRVEGPERAADAD